MEIIEMGLESLNDIDRMDLKDLDYCMDIIQTVEINGYEYDFKFNYERVLFEVIDEYGFNMLADNYDAFNFIPYQLKQLSFFMKYTLQLKELYNTILHLFNGEPKKIKLDLIRFNKKKGVNKKVNRLFKIKHVQTKILIYKWR